MTITKRKKAETSERQSTKPADDLTSKKSEAELTEKELGRAAGGINWGDGSSKDAAIGKV
jgi:hypothetical protein